MVRKTFISKHWWWSAKKNSKSNKIRIFAQSSQGRWILFLNLELPQDLFYVEYLPSRIITDFTYYLSCIIVMENFRAYITYFSVSFITLESLFSYIVVRKELAIFLFVSAISEKQAQFIEC